MTYIKIAEKEDLTEATKLVAEGISELDFDSLKHVDYDVLADSVAKCWFLAPCFLIMHDDKPVGVASLALSNMPWQRNPYLTSNMVYVRKGYRSYAIMYKLYEAIKNYADMQGLYYHDSFVCKDRMGVKMKFARSGGLDISGFSIMYEGK